MHFCTNILKKKAVFGVGDRMKKNNTEMRTDKTHEKEKNQFIREQIRPQRRKAVRKYFRRILLVMSGAVMFGGIAALSFWVMQEYLPWHLSEEEWIVATPQPSEVVVGDSDQKTGEIPEGGKSFAGYFEKLAGIGDTAASSLVGIYNSGGSQSAENSTNRENCGFLFQETDKNYFILTDYAMAETAEAVNVRFCDGTESKALLVERENRIGLAVFRIPKEQVDKETRKQLTLAEFGGTESVQTGTPVLAVGMPNGILYSVHIGMITNAKLIVPVVDQELKIYTINIPYQPEAAGMVLDRQGKIIGMITSKYTDVSGTTDMAFISISSVLTEINLMLQGKTLAYFGITGCSVDSLSAEKYGLKEGVYITSVDAGSPAYKGGMRVADVITGMDGEDISSFRDLHSKLAECRSGDKVKVTLFREDNAKRIKKKYTITLQ